MSFSFKSSLFILPLDVSYLKNNFGMQKKFRNYHFLFYKIASKNVEN